MIQWLDGNKPAKFPETHLALDEPNGVLAAGGALSTSWLLAAYRQGIFPWYSEGDPILWWSPSPRLVITEHTFRLPRTVRKLCNRGGVHISQNRAFERVIEACSEPRGDDDGTWIDDDMKQAYIELHHQGHALSVEGWNDQGELIGGLYGVSLGSVFFGESMFSRQSNASKIIFATWAKCAFEAGLTLIDCQMYTDHLAQFGGTELDRPEFEHLLAQGVDDSDIAAAISGLDSQLCVKS